MKFGEFLLVLFLLLAYANAVLVPTINLYLTTLGTDSAGCGTSTGNACRTIGYALCSIQTQTWVQGDALQEIVVRLGPGMALGSR